MRSPGSDARIAALMESGRSVPPELEGSIRALSERLDRAQLSQGDQLALGALEDRIVKLSEKLDASDARLSSLDAHRARPRRPAGHLEEMPAPAARADRAPVSPSRRASAPQPIAAGRASSTIRRRRSSTRRRHRRCAAPSGAGRIVAPAPPPSPHGARADPGRSAAGARGSAPPAAAPQPIDPNLPPDTPLEPGSGAPRIKPGSPAARIAASEAALGNAGPHRAATGGAAAAALPRAPRSRLLDTPVKLPKTPAKKAAAGSRNRRRRSRSSRSAALRAQAGARSALPRSATGGADAARRRRGLQEAIGQHIKTLLIAGSVVIIVLARC